MKRFWLMSLAFLAGAAGAGQDAGYSPGVAQAFPKRPFFGDLHLHSNKSADSYSMGNVLLGPETSYRFARGEEVLSSNGLRARLKRPLDFLSVTDHAEFLGLYRRHEAGDAMMAAESLGSYWESVEEEQGSYFMAFVWALREPDPVRDDYSEELKRAVWRDVVRVADEYNDPGTFTAFAGYEWTSMLDGNNLHRCVIYRDGAEKTAQLLPFSTLSSRDPEDLWAALEHYEKTTGGDVLAIPHNGNLSNGLMWDLNTFSGGPLDASYAQRRSQWEPIAEVTQIKGDSETHPILSPDDEFADFERWDEYNIANTHKTEPHMLPSSYARSALRLGLAEQQRYGTNPFKFGMIGSTDDHTSLPTAAEDNFFGKFANSEPGIRTPDSHMAGALIADWQLSASGLAAVWARENTRESLFDAMERREVYATTGSRIVLRLFGGWDFPAGAVHRPDYETVGYQRGVPMGSDLAPAPEGVAAPSFMVLAARDPDSANLDRIQIVKGWVDGNGKTHERVFDVALSDGRTVNPATGKADPVGSTVDLDQVTFSNTIGEAMLAAQWTDPNFDPSQGAFYYARVIEIPKPRWTEYDRKHYGITLPDEVPRTVQDRAYSSPIWYHPG